MGLLFPKIDDFIEQMPLLLMLAAGGLLTALGVGYFVKLYRS